MQQLPILSGEAALGRVRLALLAGMSVAGIAVAGDLDFVELGTMTPPPGETFRDIGGWNDILIVRCGLMTAGQNRTETLDLSDPSNPVLLDSTSGFGLRLGFGCDFYWEENIEVKNGRYQFTQAIFCTFDAGGQKGFSLQQESSSAPLPGQDPGVVGTVGFSDGDLAGFVFGSIGDGFVATYRENEDLVYLDGVDAQMGIGGEIDTDNTGPIPQSSRISKLHADGDRVYLRSNQPGDDPLYAFDVSDLTNPVLLYDWGPYPQHIGGGLGYVSNGGMLDIYDMMQAGGPQIRGSLPVTGTLLCMHSIDGLLYIGASDGLFVFDVSDPDLPTLVGSYTNTDGAVRRLAFGPDRVHMLVDDSRIVSLSTNGPGPCGPADFVEPHGVLDLADIQAFVGAFVAQDPIADLAAPVGVFDLADLQAFVVGFNAGCP